MIKAIIFDFGGVITHTEPWDGWSPTLEERNTIKDAISEIAKLFEKELKESKFTADDFDREFKLRTTSLKKEYVEKIIKSICDADKGVLELISKLSSRYKIYGLVNAPFGWTELRRGIHGLDKYFTRVFVSYEIDVRKPDPRIFNYFFENTGLKGGDCLFIDDKEENIIVAKQLGMEGYVFKSTKELEDYINKFL